MLKSGLFLGLTVIISIFAACEKPEVYDEKAQLAIDEALIKEWAAKTNTTLVRDDSGLYYKIITEGSGSESIEPTDTLTVEYEGKLLNDTIFSKATAEDPFKFLRETVMPGWRIGLTFIKEGGQIQLLVPSALAYMNHPTEGVPANSVLNFMIDLKKVAKKEEKNK